MTNETKGMLLGLCGVIAFSLTLPFTRAIIHVFDPLFIASGRVILATLAAIAWLKFTQSPIPNKSQWKKIIVVASGITFGFPIFTSIAMKSLPASHGGVVLGLLPMATAIFGALIYHERPSIAFWATCLIGSALVVVYSLLQGGGHLQQADIALLIAVVSVSISYAVGATLSRELGGLQVVSWALVISSPILLVVAIATSPIEFATIKFTHWLSLIYLALVSQWLSFLFWYKGLAIGGIARVSQIQLLQPFITIFASVVIVGEWLDTRTILFASLVVVVVALGRRLKAS